MTQQPEILHYAVSVVGKDRPGIVAAIWRRVTAGEVKLLYLSPERLMTDRMIAALDERRGKSALHRARCRVTPGAGILRENLPDRATETYRPHGQG